MKKCTKCNSSENGFYLKASWCKICMKNLCAKRTLLTRKPNQEFFSMEGEKWEVIKENYLISNMGRVYRNEFVKNGVRMKAMFMKLSVLSCGYYKIHIDGKTKTVHRIVAEKFIENPLNKKFVNHKDSNRLNNHYSNLEWVTPMENIHHSLNKGRMSKKLSKEDVLKIRSSEKTTKDLAYEFKVSTTNIRLIKRYKIWVKC